MSCKEIGGYNHNIKIINSLKMWLLLNIWI